MTTAHLALPRSAAVRRRARGRPARADDPGREDRPARVDLGVRGGRRRRRSGSDLLARCRPGRPRRDHPAGRFHEPAADRRRPGRQRHPAVPRRGDPARDPGDHPRGVPPRPAGLVGALLPAVDRGRGDLRHRPRRHRSRRRSGERMLATGARHALGPVLDIGRDPRWGRIEETYGEDPYLPAELGLAYIRALQGPTSRDGVIATGKHMVGHGLAEGGMNQAPVHVGPRELRDEQLFPFEVAVREGGLASMMPAYCDVDGVPCHASRELLDGILRDEWGFDGIVASDYTGIAMLQTAHRLTDDPSVAAALALAAGVDLELPRCRQLRRSRWPMPWPTAGSTIGPLDALVHRVLRMKFRLGLFERPYVDEPTDRALADLADPTSRAVGLELARRSMVLLENDGVLPLAADLGRVALIGPIAASVRDLLGDYSHLVHMRDPVGDARAGQCVRGLAGRARRSSPTDELAGRATILHALRARLAGRPGHPRRGDRHPRRHRRRDRRRRRGRRGGRGGDRRARRAVRPDRRLDDRRVPRSARPRVPRSAAGAARGGRRDRHAGRPRRRQRAAAGPRVGGPPLRRDPAGVGPRRQRARRRSSTCSSAPRTRAASCRSRCRATSARSRSSYRHHPTGGRSNPKGDYVDGPTRPLWPFGFGRSYTTFELSDLRVDRTEVATADGEVDRRRRGRQRRRPRPATRSSSSTSATRRRRSRGRSSSCAGSGACTSSRASDGPSSFTLRSEQFAFTGVDLRQVVEPGRVTLSVGTSSADRPLSTTIDLVGPARRPRRSTPVPDEIDPDVASFTA